jgi:hypothetical protein
MMNDFPACKHNMQMFQIYGFDGLLYVNLCLSWSVFCCYGLRASDVPVRWTLWILGSSIIAYISLQGGNPFRVVSQPNTDARKDTHSVTVLFGSPVHFCDIFSLWLLVFVILLVANPEVRVRFPALPDFLSSSGSGTGSTQPLWE